MEYKINDKELKANIFISFVNKVWKGQYDIEKNTPSCYYQSKRRYDMDFATTLKTIRKEKGYTQSSLAKELNVSQNAVYNWENKKCEPSIEMIKKIADVLDVSLYDLIVISTDLTISSEETAKMAGVILDQIHDKKVLSTSGEIYLNRYYSMLNDTGKQLAVDYVEGLTENPKYTLKADNDESTDYHDLSQAENNLYTALDKYKKKK